MLNPCEHHQAGDQTGGQLRFRFPAKSSLVHQGQGVLQASIQLDKASLQNGFFDTRRNSIWLDFHGKQ
jgi:hypothetical protein